MPLVHGWVVCFRMAEAKAAVEELDQWPRRRLRCILWRQWERPRTRAKRLMTLGFERQRAFESSYNGHGQWWNVGASPMNHAVPTRLFRTLGFPSLIEEQRRLQCPLRTVVYGPVRTEV